MTAKEAKETASAYLLTHSEGEYQLIIQKITATAKTGLFGISVGLISEIIRQRLIDDGYNVLYHEGLQRDLPYYSIEWS